MIPLRIFGETLMISYFSVEYGCRVLRNRPDAICSFSAQLLNRFCSEQDRSLVDQKPSMINRFDIRHGKTADKDVFSVHFQYLILVTAQGMAEFSKFRSRQLTRHIPCIEVKKCPTSPKPIRPRNHDVHRGSINNRTARLLVGPGVSAAGRPASGAG